MRVEEVLTEVGTVPTCGGVPTGRLEMLMARRGQNTLTLPDLPDGRNRVLLICVSVPDTPAKISKLTVCCYPWAVEEISQVWCFPKFQDPRPHLCFSRSATIISGSLGHEVKGLYFSWSGFSWLSPNPLSLLVSSGMALKWDLVWKCTVIYRSIHKF